MITTFKCEDCGSTVYYVNDTQVHECECKCCNLSEVEKERMANELADKLGVQ